MSGLSIVRVWRGWRIPGSNWAKFVRDLATVFIPATWQVMGRLGLQCYVPSVLAETKSPKLPDEVALLFYPSKAAYLAARSETVAGRAYSLLHQAVFNFSSPPASTTGDASIWPKDDTGTGDWPWWRQAQVGGSRFMEPQTTVVFIALVHGTSTPAVAAAVFLALGYADCEAVVYSENDFTLAWVAVPGPVEQKALAAQVAASVPNSQVASAHVALKPQIEASYFAKSNGVALQSDQTMFFCSYTVGGHE